MKSRIVGVREYYQKMYDVIKDWDNGQMQNESHLFGADYCLCDAPYFGWDGAKLRNEHKIYENVERQYKKLKCTLEEALGI